MSEQETEIVNGLSQFADGLALGGGRVGLGTQVGRLATLFNNERYALLSYNRVLLSQMYTEHGIIQTLIDQPVDDGFRSGFTIQTSQLDADDLEFLEQEMKRDEILKSITQTIKWGRLFGGSGLIVVTNQDYETPLDINRIREFSDIEFIDADLWELTPRNVNDNQDYNHFIYGDYFYYYGKKIHKSRVLTYNGKDAPSWTRRRLRGWGMSEVERVVRSFNQYLKNQNVIFELLDEAKIDVMKIKGFNQTLLTDGGTQKIVQRVQLANQTKNFNNALVMDAEDDHEQKQMAFSGLGEVLTQIREQIASDLKFPITKLFGVSSAGFNSGEDDIENYNSMVEGEVRAKSEPMVLEVISLLCAKYFGFIPDDLAIEWQPLRILGAEQEEKVKNQKLNRILATHQNGLINAKQAKEAINRDNLLPVEIDEDDVVNMPLISDNEVTLSESTSSA